MLMREPSFFCELCAEAFGSGTLDAISGAPACPELCGDRESERWGDDDPDALSACLDPEKLK
jgi:hypothetical protein